MKLRYIMPIMFLLLVTGVSAVETEIRCNDIYDDFLGDSLDLTKWEEYDASKPVDEHYLDVGEQNYHTAQLTTADKGIELKMLQQLQAGDIIDFDINYNSASGNHWGCVFWDEQADWSLNNYITCLGHWNSIDAYSGVYGTYHYQAKYNENSVDVIRTLPNGNTESWRGFEGAISPPYGFSVHSRTGGDGTSHFDFDNFRLCEINYAPEIQSYFPTENQFTIYETDSVEFTHTSIDQNNDNLVYSWKLDDVEQGTEQNWVYVSDYESSGYHTITLTVSDGSLETSQSWNVHIINVNRPPALDPISNIVVSENELIEIMPTATDLDGDNLNYNLDDSRFSYDNEINIFTWQTNYEDEGIYTVNVGVEEIKDVTLVNVGSHGTIMVDVDGTLDTIPALSTKIVNGVEITVLDTFYAAAKSERAALLEIDSIEYFMEVVDIITTNGEADSQAVEITVRNVNRYPVLTTISDQTWDEDTSITINLNEYFTDPDESELSYSYLNPEYINLTTPPEPQIENLNILIAEGIVTLTPDANWYGIREIMFVAHDPVPGMAGEGSNIYSWTGVQVNSNKVVLTVNDVAEPSPPSSGSPSGGGGRKLCVEKWACSTWGACKNQKQTRTCVDTSNCGTRKNQPEKEQTCVVKEEQTVESETNEGSNEESGMEGVTGAVIGEEETKPNIVSRTFNGVGRGIVSIFEGIGKFFKWIF